MFLIFLYVEYSIFWFCYIANTTIHLNYRDKTITLPPQQSNDNPDEGKTYCDKYYMFPDFRSVL